MKKIQLLSLIAAMSVLYSCNEEDKSKNPLGETDVIPVKISAVSALGLPQKINATGLVSTENEAKYSFKIGGVINRVLVEEGQFFKKGQLLATLNSTEISAGLEQASLNVDKTQRDYTRAVNLYKDSVFTLEQLQNTKTALDIAQKAKEAIAFNERYSKIYAASDGFVTQKIANEGEVIGAGTPVFIINETNGNDNYLLKVGVTDREWSAVSPGQAAKVTLDGYAGKEIDAFVFRKSQAADRALGSFQVELKLKLKDIKPAVGMFGKAEISTNSDENVNVIPYSSLVEADGDKAFVFAPEGTGKVRKIPVTISKIDNQQVYLREGLADVKEIVVSNSAYLNEKSTIKIIR
ncbi:RND family efflux transporter, MFP subunit [Chitinophaga rupis]|uniref:RND family efflux transporter, MFP subunit n=1 Tax=Chitinophaga rupis TaxID=573321 RepID=A0A1H8B3K0_9BACT|nr:efflux RND transporter periplasmic adaptor subunit [Chitinophaga rupis]SEM76668.1 RND family efflux transporter, MFP subunit [Chitinophaga rupis]